MGRPPISSFFPFATLFRSHDASDPMGFLIHRGDRCIAFLTDLGHMRSEEHTSELQSQFHLVFRPFLIFCRWGAHRYLHFFPSRRSSVLMTQAIRWAF